jgi:arginine deiminase
LDSEWGPLRSVLLHRPGREMEAVLQDPKGALLLEAPDPAVMRIQHEALAQVYRSAGVGVHHVDPPVLPPPNQLFSADLLAMTPEGAILGRPASEVRAGEERWVARALAELGVPILRSVGGHGTFEGADLMWLRAGTALLAQGLRTNGEGAAQVEATLREIGAEVHRTHLPPGTMHLMGQLRIPDRELAMAWPGRLPQDAVDLLEGLGFAVHFVPDEEEAREGFALNFVTLGPRKILMPAGNPVSLAFYEELGVECLTVEVGELGKAAGSIGCLTGILEREMTAVR